MLRSGYHLLRYAKGLNLQFVPSKRVLIVEGPQGVSLVKLVARLNSSKGEGKFWLTDLRNTKKSFFGLNKVLLSQIYLGVRLGYRSQLNLLGVGYQVSILIEERKKFLVFRIGFSHLVKILIPSFLVVNCPKPRIILITGIDLDKVNNFASFLRRLKLPSAYKEKGLYYKGEVNKIKQGKKT